jgi:hypothetical protein
MGEARVRQAADQVDEGVRRLAALIADVRP